MFLLYVVCFKKLLDEPVRDSIRDPSLLLYTDLLEKYLSDLHTRANSVSPETYHCIMASVHFTIDWLSLFAVSVRQCKSKLTENFILFLLFQFSYS